MEHQWAEEQRRRAEAAEARIQQARTEAEERAQQARAEAEDRARQERERADRYLEEMIRINQSFLSATERLVRRLPDINGNNGEGKEPHE